jgi:hypothetical protein
MKDTCFICPWHRPRALSEAAAKLLQEQVHQHALTQWYRQRQPDPPLKVQVKITKTYASDRMADSSGYGKIAWMTQLELAKRGLVEPPLPAAGQRTAEADKLVTDTLTMQATMGHEDESDNDNDSTADAAPSDPSRCTRVQAAEAIAPFRRQPDSSIRPLPSDEELQINIEFVRKSCGQIKSETAKSWRHDDQNEPDFSTPPVRKRRRPKNDGEGDGDADADGGAPDDQSASVGAESDSGSKRPRDTAPTSTPSAFAKQQMAPPSGFASLGAGGIHQLPARASPAE